MSSYNPPTEDITQFNSSLFNQPEETLSQAEADLLYLSKTKNDTSTATLTTFNNQVNVGTLNTTSIKSANPASSTHTLFDNMTAGGTLTIGNMITAVALKGAVSVGQYGTAGGTLTLYRKLNIQDINGNATGFGEFVFGSAPELGIFAISVPSTLVQTFVRLYNCAAGSTTSILRLEVGNAVTITDGTILNTRQIKSTSTASTTHTLFDNMTTGGVLTIGNTASSNTINGNTDFGSNVSIKNKLKLSQTTNVDTNTTLNLNFPIAETTVIRTTTAGVTAITIALPNVTANEVGLMFNFFKFQTNLAVTFTTTSPILIYTLNSLGAGSTSNTSLLSVDKMMTTLMCGTYGGSFYWVEVSNYSTFDREYNNGIYPRLTTENNFSNRLNFSAASYSFPFESSQSLGYYLKTTGTAFTTLTTGIPKTILSTASIPIGVWRIDFSVTNLVTSAGTITQSQTYISPTLDGNIATAVDFTGSVIRSHVSEVYALNDVQEIAGSFTYQQTTAGVLRLNIVKSFGSGTYSFTGEIAITRLA